MDSDRRDLCAARPSARVGDVGTSSSRRGMPRAALALLEGPPRTPDTTAPSAVRHFPCLRSPASGSTAFLSRRACAGRAIPAGTRGAGLFSSLAPELGPLRLVVGDD